MQTSEDTLLSVEELRVHFRGADEVFLSGNMSKVTPVTAFDETVYEHGPVARRARALYWDWAHSAP